MNKDYLYLSKRNVLTLLSKLNRAALGEVTACTLIKSDNQHPVFAQTMEQIEVTSVENDEKDHLIYNHGIPHIFLTRETLMILAYELTLNGKVYSIDIDNVISVSIVPDDLYYVNRNPGPVLACDDPSKRNI